MQQVDGSGEATSVEVEAKRKRRKYSAAQKVAILAEAQECKTPQELGALVRRKGLYATAIIKWRMAHKQGQLQAGSSVRKAKQAEATAAEVAALKRALAHAEANLKRALALVELQKKISELLGIQQPCSERL